MGQPNIPAAPSAPDYGAATREGMYADIDTLDTRRQIENAARLGKSVQIYNPVSGVMETKDFSGLGDAEYARQAAELATEQNEIVQRQQLRLRQELGTANARQTRNELEAADPVAFEARDSLQRKLANDMAIPDGDMVVAPSGNVRAGATALADLAYNAPGADARIGQQGGLYDQANSELRSTASDGGTLADLQALQKATAGDTGARNALGALQGQASQDTSPAAIAALQAQAATDPGARAQYAAMLTAASKDPTAANLAVLQSAAANDPGARSQYQALLGQSASSASRNRLGSIYDEATRLPTSASDPTTATLNAGLEGALADYRLGGKLDETTKRDLLNDVRAGQVARGNYLGDAAAVVEATELGNAAEQRKAQRLQTVLAAQGQAFGQNSSLRDQETAMRNNRLGALTNLQGQDFGQETALRGEQAGLAGMSAQEMQQLRAEQAGYGTTAAGINSQLRGEQANLAGLGAREIQQLRGEQAGYAGAAADRTAALRGEQAGYATGAQGLSTQQTATLAQLAQQIYGTGAAVRGEQLAANQGRLGTLAQLAGQDTAQQQQAYTSRLNAMGQAQQGNLNIANEERAARAETTGRNQQKLANVSAMVLGQPITNQFGSLQGAQQGAVGFQPINYQPGTGLNQNAGQQGASFAQGNFGTNSSNWNTTAGIAAQGNPWMALAGQGLGTAAGAAGAKLGAMI